MAYTGLVEVQIGGTGALVSHIQIWIMLFFLVIFESRRDDLHSLTPVLSVLQGRGHSVALVTDGRMSGASGKVPAAIHVCPEALDGGPIARLRDGDMVRVDAIAGTLEILTGGVLQRPAAQADLSAHHAGCGRELFGTFRRAVNAADCGATILGD